MKLELSKELKRYKDIVTEQNYEKFREIREMEISYIPVDNNGANSPIPCGVTIPSVPGDDYKKLSDSVKKLETCF
ncbi:MAG: hypothetical protein OXB84_04370, partial [Halobacteriovoraceae bacterium]|nr:hypothetical protein [Halobacteriovoraceae bacterium]